MIYVPQGAFEAAFNSMLVKLEVTEALKKSDMVLAALHTQSGSEMLESAGMIELRAYQGKKELQLKDGKEVQLFLPSDGDLENMQVFYADEHMDWKVDSAQSVTQFIPENMRTREVYEVPVTEVVPCRFFSCRLPRLWSRELSDRQTIPGASRKMQRVRVMEKRWFYMTNPVMAEAYGVATIEEVVKAREAENLPVNTAYAAFSSSELGWINCDRFITPLGRRTDVICRSDDQRVTHNYLVFENVKGVMSSAGFQGQAWFDNLPIGKKVKLVSIRVLDGQPQMCMRELKLSRNHDETLEYTPVTQEELEERLQVFLDQ